MLFRITVFFHVVFVVGMCVTNCIEWMAIMNMGRAPDAPSLRIWRQLNNAGKWHPVWGVGVLVTGLYFSSSAWRWTTPFVLVGLLATIALAVGGALLGRRIQDFERALEAYEPRSAGSPPSCSRLLRVHGALSGVVFGLIYTMIVKPDLVGALAAVVIAAVAGGVGPAIFADGARSSSW